jgi:hypothetical protein
MSLPLPPSRASLSHQQVEASLTDELTTKNPNVEVDRESPKKEVATVVRFDLSEIIFVNRWQACFYPFQASSNITDTGQSQEGLRPDSDKYESDYDDQEEYQQSIVYEQVRRVVSSIKNSCKM